MENEKNLNTTPDAQELPDESLDAVAGGDDGSHATYDHLTNPSPEGWDSQGNVTHWKSEIKGVYHYECPKCGRLLHNGSGGYLYCDPCDKWFSSSLFGSAVEVEGWYIIDCEYINGGILP